MARNTTARLEAVRENLSLAVTGTLRAMPLGELEQMQAIFDAVTEPRRRLSAEQAAMWRKFEEDFRRRYAELVAQQVEDDQVIIWP